MNSAQQDTRIIHPRHRHVPGGNDRAPDGAGRDLDAGRAPDGAGRDLDAGRAPDGAGTLAAGDVDLATDPFADDLQAQLAARARRPWTNRSTVALAALVLFIAGFAVGARVERDFGAGITRTGGGSDATGQSGTVGGASGRFGARQLPGASAGALPGAGRDATGTPSATAPGQASFTGTVKLVDGTTVYIGTGGGDVLTVRTGAGTTVVGVPGGKVSGLAPGDMVTVEGSGATANGTLTATRITRKS